MIPEERPVRVVALRDLAEAVREFLLLSRNKVRCLVLFFARGLKKEYEKPLGIRGEKPFDPGDLASDRDGFGLSDGGAREAARQEDGHPGKGDNGDASISRAETLRGVHPPYREEGASTVEAGRNEERGVP